MTAWDKIRKASLLIELALLVVIAVGVWRLHSTQPCQIALRDKSSSWARGTDGLCHIEGLLSAPTTR